MPIFPEPADAQMRQRVRVWQNAGAPVAAVNDVQTITVDSCTHSTLTLTNLPGGRSYTAVQDVSTAALQTALRALLGTNAVAVTGTYAAGSGGTYILTWGGNYAGLLMTLLGVSATFVGGSSPAVAIVHTTPGVAPTYRAQAAPGALLVDTTNLIVYINAGSLLIPSWVSAIAASTELVNFLAAIPTVAVADIAATTDITAVPGTFADVAAVRSYLAGANVIPNIESRLDALEATVNDLLAKLRTALILTP
jgi:hypothetical protein